MADDKTETDRFDIAGSSQETLGSSLNEIEWRPLGRRVVIRKARNHPPLKIPTPFDMPPDSEPRD